MENSKVIIEVGNHKDVSCITFENESHTLGNSLRFMLMKNKKVDFCGYTVPHPLERKMVLRVQTNNNHNAVAVVEESFDNLMELTEHIMDTFCKELTNFKKNEDEEMKD